MSMISPLIEAVGSASQQLTQYEFSVSVMFTSAMGVAVMILSSIQAITTNAIQIKLDSSQSKLL